MTGIPTSVSRAERPCARSPDHESEMLFRSCYVPMVRLAALLVGQVPVAEDLVQDAFVRVVPKLDGVERAPAYLRSAVVNACRSWQRRHARERRAMISMAGPKEDAGTDPPGELAQALARLSERQRAAVVLRYWEDLSEADIAAVLGCRPGTVKSLLNRGLAALRKELDDDDA